MVAPLLRAQRSANVSFTNVLVDTEYAPVIYDPAYFRYDVTASATPLTRCEATNDSHELLAVYFFP